jgi:hypothetical protein
MEKPTSQEALEIEIRKKVEEVKARSMNLKDAKKATKTFDKWYYSDDRSHDAELENIQEEIMNSSVTVHTLAEYKMVLQSMMDDDEAEEILAHENAHANVAQSLGAEFLGYSLLICKDGDEFVFRGGAPYRLPSEWSTEKKKAAHLRIYGAPEEYGEENSPTDEKVVNSLKNR